MVLLIGTAMAPSLIAQSLISGDITGTVTDPSGAVISNASITLKSDATGATRSTISGGNGGFRFSLLSPGSYTLTITAQGFAKAEAKANVAVGQAAIADVTMELGTTTQTVEVTSAAPLVQSETADLSTAFSQTLVSSLPNGGNDITYIAQTAPGVSMQVGGGYGNFSAYGLPSTSNLFTVNGENDMDPYLNVNNSGASNLTLGRNEMQEATVISNAYSGQYGQQAGAQVNYVTKSGSNAFHGNAIYWWNGRTMNANDWFNNFYGIPRAFANNNQWAASVGGPIKKDKLFFFGNTEGLRFILPASGLVYAWTPSAISAITNNIAANQPASLPLYQKYFQIMQGGPNYGHFTGGDGGCDIPGSRPTEGNPGFGNCIGSYQTSAPQLGNEYIISGRIDYNVSDNDHLYWRVRMDHGTQPTGVDFINPAFNSSSYQPSYDGQGQWNHIFSPNATNQFVYAGSYYRAIFTQVNPSLFPIDVFGYGFNLTDLGGPASNGGVANYPQGRNVTQYQFVDDFSWIHGPHALKFGANFRRYDVTDYTFSVLNNPYVYLLDEADFYNGTAYLFRERVPSRATQPVAIWGLGVYGQDDWRVSKNLKLMLALRAEHNSNPVCQLNCASQLAGNFNALVAAGTLSPSTPYNQFVNANRHQVWQGTDVLNFAPRIGFTWSPLGNDKTVVRGGFGLFYDALPATLGDPSMRNMPGLVEVRVPNGLWADPTSNGAQAIVMASANAIMTGFSQGASYNSLKGDLGSLFRTPAYTNFPGTLHTPYYEQWSFGLQQAIGDKSSVGLAYVGNHGENIPVLNYPNAYISAANGNYGPFPLTAPTVNFTTVSQYTSAGTSGYNGLTATFNQRISYGFTVQASYTWSHTLDDVSNGGYGVFYNANSSINSQINPFCLSCNNYGPADYDIRHSFNASYVWQTPWKFGNRWAKGAFEGWTLSQNFFARSGLPWTAMDSTAVVSNYGAANTTIANLVPGVAAQQGCSNGLSVCANVNAFSTVGPDGHTVLNAFPNQRRNSFRGPGFFDSDFSINKNFKLTERLGFSVGANFYNVFNHPNFQNPSNTDVELGASDPRNGVLGFGTITQMAVPPTGPYGSFFANLPSGRMVQFQGKIVF
jgi:outer membrane receptor protein involved in Fe transport